MKKLANSLVLLFIILFLPQTALGAEYLIPVGQVIGLELGENRVCVAGFDTAIGQSSQAAGLQIGDEICCIDGNPVHTAEDVREALWHSKGVVTLEILRGKDTLTLRLNPVITADGPKLGVYLRQGVTGIGTVTWYDPETGRFAALGHSVNTPSGALVAMVSGQAYSARVMSVRQGRVGQPGQLVGSVTSPSPIGHLHSNTVQGVFGTAQGGWEGQAIPVAQETDIRTGKATIRSTVDGTLPRDYSVEILKIYPDSRAEGRNMLIRVTDPALLAATGGIVQGMSGSPIIQDGKLVGAVTHVLVNDPTRGYGIFIENMLDAAK